MEKRLFYKEYTKIVIPLMLQGLIQNFVSMVDNLMVGQLGDNAIGAVAMGNRMLGMVMFTVFGVSSATSVFIAQYFGAKNREKQQESFRIGLIMSSAILFAACLLFLLFPFQIIRFFIQGEVIERYTFSYIKLMLIGFIPYVLTINYSSASKAVGQVRLPLIASLTGVAINTLLNYVLIFGHFGFSPMGIEGAAIATVISRIVEFTIVYGSVCYYKFAFNTRVKDIFNITPELFKTVFSKALPLAINEIIWSFGQATILKFYGSKGGEVISAYAINDTANSIFFSFAYGLSGATPVLISQRLGSGKLKEAYWNAKMMLKTVVVVSVILGAILASTSLVIPYLYNVSTTSRDLAVNMIRLAGLLLWIYLTNTQIYFIMRSGGDMKSTLMMDGLFYWCVTIPVMAGVTYLTQIPVLFIFVAGQGCELIKLGISLYFFFKKRWLNNMTATNDLM